MLDEACAGQEYLEKAQVLQLVDDYVRKNNLYYQAQRHKISNSNSFYHPEDSKELYDVAFYNPMANPNRFGHHKKDGMPDICYARLRGKKKIRSLVGNLQIDDSLKNHPWDNPSREKIMLARKNMYQNMVQEAIRHALQAKKSKILFQTGDAALIAPT